MTTIGKYERKRGRCVNCGKRRLVTRCPCPVCRREWDYIVICAECEDKEMSCWYDRKKASHLRQYDFKTKMIATSPTTSATIEV